MRAVDLYAGVGGWAVGLKMAGIDIACSYEWWQPAASTHHANSKSEVKVVDIRKLAMSDLPQNVDLLVGSPPCTQFSYSNRGGAGNIEDGLKDIKCFLDAVRQVKPKFWVFENVPRVMKVLEAEMSNGGSLTEYQDILEDANIEVFDMANFGVPQRRKRCIAGNFDISLLKSYADRLPEITLGYVMERLAEGFDPCFKNAKKLSISDNEKETPLSWEEERFNRDMKVAHPIYNGMPFPDPLDRTSRTVTATCTRVSRESLVILDSVTQKYRRLSVRERASLQGFPVTFQFIGRSHAEKLKMVGNAIPPLFTYLIAEAIKGTRPEKLTLPSKIDANKLLAGARPTKTTPDTAGKSYPPTRRFRFAIPNLRFKSGMRFELANVDGSQNWGVGFYFGDSKHIERRDFDAANLMETASLISEKMHDLVIHLHHKTLSKIEKLDLSELQSTWARETKGLHPFKLLDLLGKIADDAAVRRKCEALSKDDVSAFVFREVYGANTEAKLSKGKISSLVVPIAIGMIISGAVNSKLVHDTIQKIAAE